MAKRADILDTLSRTRLLELARKLDIEGLTGSRKAAIREALVQAREVADAQLLDRLKRDDLKAACRALGLDDAGRAKQPIIDRLLDGTGGKSGGKSGGVGGGASPSKPSRSPALKTSDMAKKQPKSRKRAIEQYDHADKQRANNPPVGLVTPQTDPDQPERKQYQYDPHLDPQLQWAGKAERTSFEVPTQSLHVHERIDPRTIIEAVRARNGTPGNGKHEQPGLFESQAENPPLRDALDFYKHSHNWTNRLIAGDSLLVMNSLLEKEGMAGKVQMVYVDPPYGIRYGSNFQPFVNKRDVKDRNDEDLSQEPEMLKAFRDTWELGIHSYLTYLRDRLLLAHELLRESGACFVQINAENAHLVTQVMSEVFGESNLIANIVFRKKSIPLGAKYIETMHDHLILFAKDRDRLKYRHLFEESDVSSISSHGPYALYPDKTYEKIHPSQFRSRDHPKGTSYYRLFSLLAPSYTSKTDFPYEFNGVTYPPPSGGCWVTSKEKLDILASLDRIQPEGQSLSYRLFYEDFPHKKITASWNNLGVSYKKTYAVQTAPSVVERCILMATDPGDLVLDPTCGSGTTAYVAERWGRRWITTDTSRVAITLAKQRLMTGYYDYYTLAHPDQGVSSGFKYKTVPHVTLKSIANNPEIREGMSQEQIDEAIRKYADHEVLYDQPEVDRSRVRTTGPFTVEAVPSLTVRSIDEVDEPAAGDESVARTGATVKQDEWRAELAKAGVRGRGGQMIEFARVEPLGGARFLHAQGETKPTDGGDTRRVVVSFGPEHAPLEQRQVEQAWREAESLSPKPDMLIFAAFQFDPEAAKDIDGLSPEKAGMTFLKAQMNADLLTEDLKKKRSSNESFWLIGQPDVQVRAVDRGEAKGRWQVEVRGFDYYNPRTGQVDSGATDKIAMWMLDTDYDGRSLYPRQVFFPLAGSKDGWARLAKSLKAEIDPEKIEAYRGTESLPFDPGAHERVAVKIIDDRGIESLKVLDIA